MREWKLDVRESDGFRSFVCTQIRIWNTDAQDTTRRKHAVTLPKKLQCLIKKEVLEEVLGEYEMK
jgi:hypothetical protein